MAIANALDRLALFGCDIEGAAGPHRHTPDICAALHPFRYHGFDHIARLKPFDPFGLLRFGTRKSVCIHQTHLPSAMSIRGDAKWHDTGQVEGFWGTCPHAGGIKPVRLRVPSLDTVVFRSSSRADLNRESEGSQATIEFPAHHIHGGSILERGFGLSQDALQAIGLVFQEFFNEPVPFLL